MSVDRKFFEYLFLMIAIGWLILWTFFPRISDSDFAFQGSVMGCLLAIYFRLKVEEKRDDN